MRARIWIAILSTTLPFMVAAQPVSPPPTPLHLVGDHWTPYDPPTEFPEGATVHTVVRGDTLWDLAASNLGDPYLWPQIWERNPYILDSHWIYPGDPLVIDVAVQEPMAIDDGVSESFEEPTQQEWDREPGEPEDLAIGKPYPLGSPADVYCFVRVVEDEGVFPFTVASGERIEFQDSFSEGDVIYLDGGTAEGIAAGDRFFVLHRVRKLDHPISNAEMGIIFQQVGQVKVLCAQEHTALAEINYACDPVRIGDVLEPFAPVPVPLVLAPDKTDRCDEPNGKPTGYIAYARDDVLQSGPHMLILLDHGTADGLFPGQFATTFRDNPVKGMPRLVIGEVGILTVEEGYSTAKVTDSWSPILVGDRIEIK